jgi:oxygen-dependent protoporphyrinogen oxidase
MEAATGSVLRASQSAPPAATNDGAFRSLRGGMGELVQALLDRLPDGSTWPSSPVTSVARSADLWTVTTPTNSFTASAVIVAAPAHAASACFSSTSVELASLCAEIPYVSTASVALSWPRTDVPHPLNGSGFVVARRHSTLRIIACSWVTSKWTGRAPDEMVLLRAFLGGAHDPDAVALSDNALVETASADLGGVLGITAPPVMARVHRWIAAGAQHNIGHEERIRRIEQILADEPGLFVSGSGFRSIGVPDCIADGRRAGAAAADYVKIRQ